MTKTEYLCQLKKYLKRLPKADYENAMEHFTEYFEEVGIEGEQKVIEELGTPKEAAAELLKNLLQEDLKKSKEMEKKKRLGRVVDRQVKDLSKETPKTMGRKIWIAYLFIMAAPIAIPLALTAIVFLLTMGLFLSCILLMIGTLSLSMVLIGIKLLLRAIVAIPYSFSGAGIITGMGLLGIGFSILFSILTIFFYQWIKWLFLFLLQKVVKIEKN